jgi:hypothetical protein
MITADAAVAIALQQLGPPAKSHATAFGFTNPYGAQCTMFPDWMFEQSGGTTPLEPGYNAIDIYNKNPANMLKVASPTAAQPGDYFFMHFYSGAIDYGHTGFVVAITLTGIWAISQNYINYSLTVGSPPAKTFFPFSQIVGYLRPAYEGGTHMDTKINKGDLPLLSFVTGINQTDLANMGAVDRTWKDFFMFLVNDPIYKDHGLPAQLQQFQKNAQILKPGPYIVK